MSRDIYGGALRWENATGLMSAKQNSPLAPQGAFVPDTMHDCDQVAVVYNKGETPPEITIKQVSGSVHTVLADGVAVAVIARAAGPAVCAEDVLLVERSI
ncbi:hypothetical protein HKX54_05850 [Sulfitobacter sp. M57]|uniref:hypothetical protein n=1 Tax=unclassified Sulfitobacter TaxID=196795 RepID=UPI0023E1745E|nr:MULTISPECIES: hypothetical protein [unclassified Sulfitobacter]MDF3413969.1 hypothetical protein [Sulfitobacter sp. KE5]MDF3420750.1 hypothetical protein [Sulfitobacter sp. KE43]MDF3432515.1 hypothetical protein [Sulfitobacter sp. KE42]MDF3458154.1 hypothetical protein [Sulfitobacter sp. S74]MDF3462055.1 hypothetical protein [Sulfitobacter sp. Ks18]